MNANLAGTDGLIYFGGRYPELRLGSNENTLTGDYVVLGFGARWQTMKTSFRHAVPY